MNREKVVKTTKIVNISKGLACVPRFPGEEKAATNESSGDRLETGYLI
jgi:hypothetical protein